MRVTTVVAQPTTQSSRSWSRKAHVPLLLVIVVYYLCESFSTAVIYVICVCFAAPSSPEVLLLLWPSGAFWGGGQHSAFLEHAIHRRKGLHSSVRLLRQAAVHLSSRQSLIRPEQQQQRQQEQEQLKQSQNGSSHSSTSCTG